MERFAELLAELMPEAARNETAVESAWLAFRLLLGDWGKYRQSCGAVVVPDS
jgi:hypothetical protein